MPPDVPIALLVVYRAILSNAPFGTIRLNTGIQSCKAEERILI